MLVLLLFLLLPLVPTSGLFPISSWPSLSPKIGVQVAKEQMLDEIPNMIPVETPKPALRTNEHILAKLKETMKALRSKKHISAKLFTKNKFAQRHISPKIFPSRKMLELLLARTSFPKIWFSPKSYNNRIRARGGGAAKGLH